MGETQTSVDSGKPKTSVFAVVSLLIPLVLFIGTLCFVVVLRNGRLDDSISYLALFPFLASGLSPATFVLGVVSLIRIRRNRALLRGVVISILGLLTSAVAFDAALRAIASIRPEVRIRICASNMMKIGEALRLYSSVFENQYPTPDKWCDALVEHTDIDRTGAGKKVFCCPGTGWRAHYGINPNCTPESPPDTVLIVDTQGGWNQFGGPQMLSLDNHYRQGSNILFNDGHVEFVKPKDIEKLKWRVEEGKSAGEGLSK